MSGGSFNYLHLWADAGTGADLVERRSTIREMADALREHGGVAALAAAAETDALAAAIDLYLDSIGKRAEPLADVWKAMEWCRSADWGPERLDDALRNMTL